MDFCGMPRESNVRQALHDVSRSIVYEVTGGFDSSGTSCGCSCSCSCSCGDGIGGEEKPNWRTLPRSREIEDAYVGRISDE